MHTIGSSTPILLSLGSNYRSELNIPMALERIEMELDVVCSSHPLRTEPIQFPYPSENFINLLIYAYSSMTPDQLSHWSKQIELDLGRSQTFRQSHPSLIPIDLDIVLLGSTLLRPQDLQRYYIPQALSSMGIHLVESHGAYTIETTSP